MITPRRRGRGVDAEKRLYRYSEARKGGRRIPPHAVAGAVAASSFGPLVIVFAVSVLLLGLFCALLRADLVAYRYGGVTLAIVLLIPRKGSAWQIAFHRFAEVSIGIALALLLAVLWPEREIALPREK